jgi:hypothetical protein
VRVYYIQIAAVIALILYVIFLRVAPYSYWFEYQSVEPVQGVYSIYKNPVFLSDATIHRDVTLYWTDRIWCEHNVKFKPVSNATDNNSYSAGDTIKNDWVFTSIVGSTYT